MEDGGYLEIYPDLVDKEKITFEDITKTFAQRGNA
jgi:hypothetical protein